MWKTLKFAQFLKHSQAVYLVTPVPGGQKNLNVWWHNKQVTFMGCRGYQARLVSGAPSKTFFQLLSEHRGVGVSTHLVPLGLAKPPNHPLPIYGRSVSNFLDPLAGSCINLPNSPLTIYLGGLTSLPQCSTISKNYLGHLFLSSQEIKSISHLNIFELRKVLIF